MILGSVAGVVVRIPDGAGTPEVALAPCLTVTAFVEFELDAGSTRVAAELLIGSFDDIVARGMLVRPILLVVTS